MKLRESTVYGIPVLITFDSGTWYWNRFTSRVSFRPHGWKSRHGEIIEYIRFGRDDNLKGACILAAKSELKRLKGEYAEVEEGERRQHAHR